MKTLTFALVGKSPANVSIQLYQKYINVLYLFIFGLFILTGNVFAGGNLLQVTNTNDSGQGSLRAAVNQANDNDQIRFTGSLFQTPQTITLTSGALNVTNTISITNFNDAPLTISANNSSRVFEATNSNNNILKSLQISNLTLTDGFSGNNQNGGAILATNFRLSLSNVTVKESTATTAGGGIAIISSSQVAGISSLINSTIANNESLNGNGGGIFFGGNQSLRIFSSTIAYNTANTGGGGIISNGTDLELKNTIVANNNSTTTVNNDISGNISSLGYNIIKDTTGSNISGITTGNQLNVDPLLGKLDYYGGKADTVSLNKLSPAIDNGEPGSAIVFDQRGFRRNIESGNVSDNITADIGSFEFRNRKFDFSNDGDINFPLVRLVSSNRNFGGNNSQYFWYTSREINSFSQIIPTTGNYDTVQYGQVGDVPVPGDYDGDGKYDHAFYRPSDGIWYIKGSSKGIYGFQWGISTDIPVPADYDNDGLMDIAVYRNGDWYILGSNDGYTGVVSLGTANDIPIPADYDGDGKADIAVYDNNGNWQIKESAGSTVTKSFGQSGDYVLPEDYDGDGKANLAVFRPNNGTWYIAKPNGLPAQNFDAIPFGVSNDVPTPTDFDGDGKTDIAIYRQGTWWIIDSSNNSVTTRNFGLADDFPPILPTYYVILFQSS